jgi:hypothetical protein
MAQMELGAEERMQEMFEKVSPNCFDRKGQPLTLKRFSELISDLNYKIIRQQHIHPQLWLSTVWLGTNHNFNKTGPPLIFETMLFFSGLQEEGCWRTSTEVKALKNHRKITRQWLRKSRAQKRELLYPLVKKARLYPFKK